MNNSIELVGTAPGFVLEVKTPIGDTITETNSAAILGSLDSIDAKLPDLVNISGQDAVPVAIASNVEVYFGSTPSVSVTNLPALTAAPAPSAQALPVRQVPAKSPGTLCHVTHTLSITNAPNKLLFGFTNGSGANIYVEKIHALNAQTATHSGTVARLQVQSGSSGITGGTTITAVTNPALVATCRNPTLSGPSGLTWNTAGTLGGTINTHEQCWWSTDEITAAGSGFANDIAAQGVYKDVFDFCDDPIVVPNGYALALVCDATAGWNGVTIVDFNLYA